MRESPTDRYFRRLNARDNFYTFVALFVILIIIFLAILSILFIGAHFTTIVSISSLIIGFYKERNSKDPWDKWFNALSYLIIFGGLAWLLQANFFPDAGIHFSDFMRIFEEG